MSVVSVDEDYVEFDVGWCGAGMGWGWGWRWG